MLQLNSLTVKQLRRFRSIKRGYWSAIILAAIIVLSLFAELLVNSRALVVSYQDELYFPVYGAYLPGTTFGLDYQYETNYRDLQKIFVERGELVSHEEHPPVETNVFRARLPDLPPFLESTWFDCETGCQI